MKKIARKYQSVPGRKFILVMSFLVFFGAAEVYSQCAMCRRVAETNYEQEKTATLKKGKSLNNGIMYLLSVPYLIGAVGAIVWYQNRKKS